MHMDISDALAYLMVAGRYTDDTFEGRLHHETTAACESRHKTHKSRGCYLIYRAEGNLIEPVRFNRAGKLGNIGYGFNAIRDEPYRKIHRQALHSATTALSLALVDTNGSPDTQFIRDVVYVIGKGGLTLYCRTPEAGGVSVVRSAPYDSESLRVANRYLSAMIADNRIETAVSLFVQSQKPENDNLRSFIAAWSALELVVNRLSKVIRPDWENLLRTEALPGWDRNLQMCLLGTTT